MLPTQAPFNDAQKALITQLLPSLDAVQRGWLSGFLVSSSAPTASATTAKATKPLTVLYGTESGNSEGLADRTVKLAKKKGFKAKMVNMAEISPASLKKSENLFVIISTWGDGEPPESAEAFHKEFMAFSDKLDGVSFSVCALGDTSYDKFCQTGKDFDTQLAKLGAKRVTDRVDCDVDFEDAYGTWVEDAFKALGPVATTAAAELPSFGTSISAFDKKNPFPSEVLDNVLLNGEGSIKETRHIELSLEGSGLTYEAGDALAVIPQNADDVVEGLLKAGNFSGDEKVELKALGELSLKDALKTGLDITALSRAVVKKYQALAESKELEGLLADEAKEEFKAYIYGREIVDLLIEHPIKGLKAQDFVSLLRKLPPRLYSIASSPKAHPDEVHLTVAAVRYEGNGKQRKGVCSTYLSDDTPAGEKALVYVHKNKNFRLPEDASKPVIMVGPGTGIAPFRAFIEERAETNANGDSWLFFGDQRYTYDFLYQLELQDHLKEGVLSKLDLAFSRDQPEKIYVQDKMHDQAEELYKWLEEGAYFYVCGDANRMAGDVHQALIEIIAKQGKMSEDDAVSYLDKMKKDKRYQRDVY